MKYLTTLVEGPGDVAAMPVLLHQLLRRAHAYDWQAAEPMKVASLGALRKRLTSFAEALRIKMHDGKCHGVLVLLDSDDICPRTEAVALTASFAAFGLPYPVAVVFAHREYEEWLVASLPSIAPNTPLLPNNLTRDYAVEGKRGVKGWLTAQMPFGFIYKETTHQEEFTRHLDPDLAQECRSFRRLLGGMAEVLNGAGQPEAIRRGLATPL